MRDAGADERCNVVNLRQMSDLPRQLAPFLLAQPAWTAPPVRLQLLDGVEDQLLRILQSFLHGGVVILLQLQSNPVSSLDALRRVVEFAVDVVAACSRIEARPLQRVQGGLRRCRRRLARGHGRRALSCLHVDAARRVAGQAADWPLKQRPIWGNHRQKTRFGVPVLLHVAFKKGNTGALHSQM